MNLIYIFADQWRRDAMGIYNKDIKTPALDSLSKEGTLFERAYSCCPLCSPARASLISGRHPHNTGVYTNCKPEIDAHLDENMICITDLIKESGYKTGYIGKWHLDIPDGTGGWDAFTPPGKKRHGFDFWYSYGTYDVHNAPHYWDTDGNFIKVEEWSSVHETEVALDFIEKNKNDDFVLFISYNPPHSPYNLAPKERMAEYDGIKRNITQSAPAPNGRGDMIPDRYKEDFNKSVVQGYYTSVSILDECIGKVVDFLKESGLYDKTYIMISADHGDMLGDHNRIAKHIWYEGSEGIPLMVLGPGIKKQKCSDVVNIPDQSRTILDLLGIDGHGICEGESLVDCLKKSAPVQQKTVLTVAFPSSKDRIEEYRKNNLDFMNYGWRSVVSKEYKLVVDKGHALGFEPKIYLYSLIDNLDENELIYDSAVMSFMLSELKMQLQKTSDNFLSDLDVDALAAEYIVLKATVK